jgi:transcriptional regulator with GAF, ATPase, and Fis domain
MAHGDCGDDHVAHTGVQWRAGNLLTHMHASSALRRAPELEGRYRTLLEINNAIVTSLRRDELLHAICEALRPVLPFDRAAINIYEPETDMLHLLALETGHKSQFVVGSTLNRKDSASGWVFDNQRPLLRRDLESLRSTLESG